jgi:methionyl-tRNA formyltransferase
VPRLIKYVFTQSDPFLPGILDRYMREFADSTAGVNIQSVAIGKRTVFETVAELYRLYGFGYFQWRFRKVLWRQAQARVVNELLGWTRRCHSVRAVAKKYGVPVTEAPDVNADSFLAHLRDQKVDLIVSISSTQYYGKKLREQTPRGIVNCHGGLLPKYRGLMPGFWALANGEAEGGVTVHFVEKAIDNGPILVQRRYRIHPHDTLEDVTERSRELAADAIIDGLRLLEAGDPPLMANPEEEATVFSLPTRADVLRFKAAGGRLY